MGESEKTVYLFTAFNEFCPSWNNNFSSNCKYFFWVGLKMLQFCKSLLSLHQTLAFWFKQRVFKVFYNSKADKTLAKDDIWLLHCSMLSSEDQSDRVPRTLVHEMLASDHMFGGSGLSSPPSPASTLALFSFFHFILRFWNQILICLSVKHSAWAISILRLRVKYRLKWNSFSNSRVW